LILNAQVVTTSFAKSRRHVDVALLPVFLIAKIFTREIAGVDNASHGFICLRDDVSRCEEPQFPDERVQANKLRRVVELMC
jgi:hypothetical protein